VSRLAIVAIGVFVVNLPFGFWRAGVRKLSLPWFVAAAVLHWRSGTPRS
jgi:hypothetical protein